MFEVVGGTRRGGGGNGEQTEREQEVWVLLTFGRNLMFVTNMFFIDRWVNLTSTVPEKQIKLNMS